MFNVPTLDLIFHSIISIASYYFAININGIAQSFVSYKLGDSTAKSLGYNSFNPLLYLNFLNISFLLIFNIPFMASVPINSFNITGQYRILKLFLLYSTQFVTSIILTILALTIYLSFYDFQIILEFIQYLIPYKLDTLSNVSNVLNYSGLSIVMMYLLIYFIYYNILLALYSLISDTVRFVIEVIEHKRILIGFAYFNHILLIAPLIIFYTLGKPLSILILNTFITASKYILFIINLIKFH